MKKITHDKMKYFFSVFPPTPACVAGGKEWLTTPPLERQQRRIGRDDEFQCVDVVIRAAGL